MTSKFKTILLLSSILFIHVSHAQLCQGSLGDPIINTTFGSGANPGAPLLSATTTYQYITSDCPNDGFYTVRNNTNACFSNSWHTLTSDHTGDPNGYFMLVNASYQPSAFYLDTVKGLCGNSTYEFAAWIMNVLLPTSSCGGGGIQPDLTFSIEKTDGTLLQSYNSGNIPSTAAPTWKQYGFFFTTPPAGSDIVLRIVNNAPGGCGNDLALDDITFRPCGPMLTTSIVGLQSTSATFCQGIASSFTFTCNVSGGFNNPSFQWQERFNGGSWNDLPGQTTTTLPRNFPSATASGLYEYRLAVAEAGNMGSPQCRVASQNLSIRINANPVTAAINDGPACTGTSLTLTATGGSQYAWNGPNGFTGSGSPLTLVNAQLIHSGKYYVIVTNIAGCVHTDSTIAVINPAALATSTFSRATICEGDSIQLTAGTGPAYRWEPFAGLSNATIYNPKASPTFTTIYSVIVSNQFSCKDTTAVTISVINKPVVNAGPDNVILKGQTIQLSGSVTGNGNSYEWSPATYINDIYSLQPYINPPADTRYILKTHSPSGCKSIEDTMFVKVYNDLFVPNAFSPNADGLNDTWNIPALKAYPSFDLFVYGRWGQLVFHTKDNTGGWDGTYKNEPCPLGAYTYLIKAGGLFFKGIVMIVR